MTVRLISSAPTEVALASDRILYRFRKHKLERFMVQSSVYRDALNIGGAHRALQRKRANSLSCTLEQRRVSQVGLTRMRNTSLDTHAW